MKLTTKIKYSIFYFVLSLPLLLIVLSLVSITFNIYRINRGIDHPDIYRKLERYYQIKTTKVEITKDRDKLGLDYYYKDGFSLHFKRKISFDPSPEDYLIYIYGSSPVMVKLPVYSEEVLSSNILEKELNRQKGKTSYKVFNFGMNWLDSFGIKEMVRESLKVKKPDLIVCYYAGAVDYDLAYRGAGIRDEYYLLKAGFLKRIVNLSFLDVIPGFKKARIDILEWFMNAYVEPSLINLAQKFNLIHIYPEPFQKYNDLIASKFNSNFAQIRDIAKRNDIPIVFVTAIDNLKAKPFGAYQVTQHYYSKGKKEKDYSKRIDLLSKARDSEVFTGDIRAKSPGYAFIRGLKADSQGVFVCDLRKELVDNQFDFGYEHFYDYGHPRPKMNKIIADKLYRFINEKGLD